MFCIKIFQYYEIWLSGFFYTESDFLMRTVTISLFATERLFFIFLHKHFIKRSKIVLIGLETEPRILHTQDDGDILYVLRTSNLI